MIDLKLLLQEERNMGKNLLNSYKVSNFVNLDKDIATLDEENASELRMAAIQAMIENKESVVLPYISGKIKLMHRPHESNVLLNNLALDFYGSRNWEVAEYIAKAVVEKGESPKALRVLGDVAQEKGDENLKWNYYERYVKADNQDIDVIIKVANHYEEIGEKKDSMSFYQELFFVLQRAKKNRSLRVYFLVCLIMVRRISPSTLLMYLPLPRKSQN